MFELIILACAGFVIAVANTLVGPTGGAMVGVVSLLVPGRAAIALHAAVSLLSSASRTLMLRRHINWPITRTIFLWSLPAIAVGAFGAVLLPDWIWSLLIGAFLILYGATGAIQSYVASMEGLRVPAFISMCASFFIGTGGALINPFIIENSTTPSQSVATQSVVVMWQHLLKLTVFAAAGFSILAQLDAFLALGGGVLAGNAFGALALKRIDLSRHRRLQRWGLALVGAVLLVQTSVQFWARG